MVGRANVVVVRFLNFEPFIYLVFSYNRYCIFIYLYIYSFVIPFYILRKEAEVDKVDEVYVE